MPMKREILIVGPMMPQLMAALERDYIVHRLWEAPDRAALLEKIGPKVKAIATNGGLGASGSLIHALPNLEIIAVYGELKSMPNVVLQPHHASGTIETRSAMGDLVARNLEAHFAGKPLLTPINY